MMPLSSIPITPQGANSILSNIGSALRLLARGDEIVEFAGKGDQKSASFGDPEMAFAAFTALRRIGAGTGVLESLERAIKPDMPISHRSALLIQLGAQLEHIGVKRPTKLAKKQNVSL
jgi:hypothetical protein